MILRWKQYISARWNVISISILSLALLLILIVDGYLLLKIFFLTLGGLSFVVSIWQEGGKNSSYLRLTLLLLLLVPINILAKRFEKVYDVTEARIFSLSPQLEEVLRKLEADIEIIGFFKTPSLSEKRFSNFMKRTEAISTKISWRLVDPDVELPLTKKYGISTYDQLVFKSGDRWILVENFNEDELVNGFSKLSKKMDKAICWTRGQLEASLEDTSAMGAYRLGHHLEQLGYGLKPVFFPGKADHLKDCSLLMILGPQKPYPKEALQAVQNYLSEGGRIFLLLDPPLEGIDSGWEETAREWGVELSTALIADEEFRFDQGQATVPLTQNYARHLITQGLGTYTYFPQVRPLKVITPSPAGFHYDYLVWSSHETSWAEATLEQSPPVFEEGKDIRGPHLIALLLTLPAEGQVFIVGDSDFIRNAHLENGGNKDLALNTLKWLAQDKDHITVTPRQRQDTKLSLTARETRIIKIVCFYVMPFLAFAFCFPLWWRRTR